MSVESIQTAKLIREYTALAPSYDQRWSDYLHASFAMTLEQMAGLPEVAKQRLGGRATFLEGEAQHLPFEDDHFQLVTSTNALHYFPDANGALREIRRVISPGGNLIITDWCRSYVSMKLLNRVLPWTRHAHVHTFSPGELKKALADAGFGIISETRSKIDWFWGLMTIHAKPLT